MKSTSQILAVLATVMLLGSVLATTSLVLQKASAGIVLEYKTLKTLSDKLKQNVLDLVTADPPQPDREKQLAKLFDNYDQDIQKLFEPNAPSADKQTDNATGGAGSGKTE